ncbi:MAG: hypothetical protein F6K30_17795 [Cyanothece sp. SIO2G6]|nr:hypothetical protein [Cyanothece sp. SIO2G6]
MPVVSFSATPTTLIESEGTVLTFQFILDAAPPAGGVTVTVNGDLVSNLNALDLFAIEVSGGEFPVGDFLFSGFDFTITSQNATISVPIFDDDDTDPDFNGLRNVTYTLQDSPNYTVDANASNVTITFADDPSLVPDPDPDPDPGTGNVIEGTGQSDRLEGTNASDEIRGQGGRDTLLGLGGTDTLLGGGGRDNLNGGDGRDLLFGEGGKDRINGGGGRDTLYGGGGADIISGQGGRDIFVLEQRPGRDTFRDFNDRQDRLGLSNGLSFENLTIVDQGRNTLIRVGGNALAILRGIEANAITEADFVDV